MPRFAGLFVLPTILACSAYGQANPPLLAQQPTLSAAQIAFVFAGDLWTVPRAGGAATRLTTSTFERMKAERLAKQGNTTDMASGASAVPGAQ